mgnify:CR=1 FL=1
MMRVLLFVLVLALAAGCTTGVDDPVFDNPNDPDVVGPLPAPEAITVARPAFDASSRTIRTSCGASRSVTGCAL